MGRLSATASKHFFNPSTGGRAIERKWASDLLLARLKTFELLPVPYFCDYRFRTNEAQGPNQGLTGFQKLNAQFAIDWGHVVDVDTRKYDDASDAIKSKRLQFAYPIATSLVNPLHDLPVEAGNEPESLGGRNLQRGWRLGLPSGQDVARAMGEKPLDDKKILIGKATGDQADLKGDILSVANGAFKGNSPLWTYILAEAVTNQEAVKIPMNENVTIQTPRLGPEILIQCSA
jgi:hypothetical protein